MAAWMTLEAESGTSRHPILRHNGYFAGDFSLTAQRQARSVHDGDTPKMVDLVLITGERLHVW